MVEDDELLEKYNTIWDKVSPDIKKEFDGEPVYSKNYLKTKIKSHADEVTNFYDKKIPRLDSNHHSYYLQVFLKECKYTEKKSNQAYKWKLGRFFR